MTVSAWHQYTLCYSAIQTLLMDAHKQHMQEVSGLIAATSAALRPDLMHAISTAVQEALKVHVSANVQHMQYSQLSELQFMQYLTTERSAFVEALMLKEGLQGPMHETYNQNSGQ